MEVVNTIGRRKTSVARVYLTAGKGAIPGNKRDVKIYFPSEILQTIINQPLATVQGVGNYDIKANIKGGGTTGQAEALRMAIDPALCEVNAAFRPALNTEASLTRARH